MSKLLKDTFAGVGKVGKYLAKGYVLEKEDGARLASKREQREILASGNKGLILDGVDKRLSTTASFEHVAIIAPPGRGKSTGYIRPNIYDKSRMNCSMVITDPSGELYADTSQQLKEQGFDIVTINPSDLTTSSQFNPFHGLGADKIIEIEQICSSIILSKYGTDKDGTWNDGAVSILEVFAKCLAYTCPEYLNLPNLNYLVQMFGTDGSDLDDWIVDHSVNPLDPYDNSIIDAWKGITASNSRMLSSYTTIAKTALKQLNNRQVQQLLSVDTVDLASFRKKKTAIFLIIPANQRQYYQFLLDIFYDRLFNILMEHYPLLPGELDVFCFLDEFGSSYIKDFQDTVNNIRKYQVSLSMVFQGISQIDQKYGKDEGQSIRSGISTFIVYSGADYQTAKEQSDIIGKRRIIQRNELLEIEERIHEIDLLPPEKIRTLTDNQILVVSSNKHPFILEFTPYYQNPKYKRMSRKGAYKQAHKGSVSSGYQLRV